MSLPKRTRAHVLETESRLNLENNIPTEWVVQSVEHDYGIDNHIEIVQNEELNGNFFSIQLKGTDRQFAESPNVSVRLDTKNVKYLMGRVELVMLILFVSTENESYWIWLRDGIKNIDYNNASYTITIPKTNKLSQAPWDKIIQFSETIRSQKIGSATKIHFLY